MYLNKTFLFGNLTRDPEMKSLPNGTAVTQFSIATNRIYKDAQGQKQEQAEPSDHAPRGQPRPADVPGSLSFAVHRGSPLPKGPMDRVNSR